jgi:hypothetical protein
MKKPEAPVMGVGEIIDRLSILTRKIYFGEEDAISEHRYLEQGLEAYGIDGKLITNTMRLTQMNIEIWNLENEMRRDNDNKMDLKEVGRRAIDIRDHNRKRVNYKTKLNTAYKGFPELKVNHRSA